MKQWPFDTGLDPQYPIYTRGNAGEVLPDVLSPLNTTLFLRHFEQAWRRVWAGDWPVVDDPGDRPTFAPLVGGRFYINLSVMRRAADLAPGTSPEEIDHQFFAVGITLPPYERPDEPGYDDRAAVIEERVTELMQQPPAADVLAVQDRVRALRREGRERRAAATDEQLLARIRDLAAEAEEATYWHLVVSAMSSVAFGAFQQGLRALYGDEGNELARRALSGLGDVESAGPGRRIAHLATLDGEAYEAAFQSFLEDYGFRGVNEWEIAAPSWEQTPDVVHRMVQATREAPAKTPSTDTAAEARRQLEADGAATKWPELPFYRGCAEFYVANRERTKAAAITVLNEIRLDAAELGARLVQRGELDAPSEVFLLTADELAAAVGGAPVPRAALAERAAHMDELRTLMAPLVVEAGSVPPLEEWTPIAVAAAQAGAMASQGGEQIAGVAGSPGVARGRARIVLDPYRDEPPHPGQVLVAPITDPGWTPMFMAAEAVVVEVGGELSHAVIVARELGIPAVVAAIGCTTAINEGDLVEVDGSNGVVRILERA